MNISIVCETPQLAALSADILCRLNGLYDAVRIEHLFDEDGREHWFKNQGAQLEMIVWVSEQRGIELSCPAYTAKTRVGIQFHQGANNHRRQFGGGKSQLIAKAVGISPGVSPRILDTTAGLAGDAFVFASLGAQVTAVERSALLALMLDHAKAVAMRSIDTAETMDASLHETLSRLTFINTDSLDYLRSAAGETPEVVYLDPMFPARKKSALVKKEMVVLQRLLGETSDVSADNERQLLESALNCASHRVVVKRPRHAKPIAGVEPSYAMQGKSTRFDIYPIKSLRSESR